MFLPKKALQIRVGDGFFDIFKKIAILAAQIDEADLSADGQARDQRALDHRMRVVQENEAVFTGAGLTLVAIAEHVLRLGRLLGDERPLHARKSGNRRPPRPRRPLVFISSMIQAGPCSMHFFAAS